MRLCPYFREQKDVHGKTESTLEKLPLVETLRECVHRGRKFKLCDPSFRSFVPPAHRRCENLRAI